MLHVVVFVFVVDAQGRTNVVRTWVVVFVFAIGIWRFMTSRGKYDMHLILLECTARQEGAKPRAAKQFGHPKFSKPNNYPK